MSRLPVIFMGHGGGPLPLLGHAGHIDLLRTWEKGSVIYNALHDEKVTSIVIVSAHHESTDGSVLIMKDETPKLLFDYGGFPKETYEYTLSNPGSPALADTISRLLSAAGITNKFETNRGHDHGVFVPMLALHVAEKRPSLPIVSVSLLGPADYKMENQNEKHWKLGVALASLRDQGTLIIGSGNSFHGANAPATKSLEFDNHLKALSDSRDLHSFLLWENNSAARLCHPRPEHLLPMIVCAGAASSSASSTGEASATISRIPHNFMGHASSHFVFAEEIG